MDIGAILLFLDVLVVTAFFIARPFLEQRQPAVAAGRQELSALMAERDSIITALQELDFDNSLGKIPVEGLSSTAGSAAAARRKSASENRSSLAQNRLLG